MFSRVIASRSQRGAGNISSIRRGGNNNNNNNSSRAASNAGSFRKASNDGASSQTSSRRFLVNIDNTNAAAAATGAGTGTGTDRRPSATESARIRAGQACDSASERSACQLSVKGKASALPLRMTGEAGGGGGSGRGVHVDGLPSLTAPDQTVKSAKGGTTHSHHQYIIPTHPTFTLSQDVLSLHPMNIYLPSKALLTLYVIKNIEIQIVNTPDQHMYQHSCRHTIYPINTL